MRLCTRCVLLRSRRCLSGISMVLVCSFAGSPGSPGFSTVDAASGTATLSQTEGQALSNPLDEEIAATRKLLQLLQTPSQPHLPPPFLDGPRHDVGRTYDQVATAVPAVTQVTELEPRIANSQFTSLPSSVEALKGKISISRNVASMVREENTILEQELSKFRRAAGRVAQREEEVNNLIQQHMSARLPRATSPLVTPPSMLQTISGRTASTGVSSPLSSTHGVSIAVRFVGFAVTVITVALVCGWTTFHDGCKLPAARAKSDLAVYGAIANRDVRGRTRGAIATSTAVSSKLQSGGLPINRVMKTPLNLRTNPGLQAGTVDEAEGQLCEP